MSLVAPVQPESVTLSEAAGRVLAQNLIAFENIPPFDRSPYDGYAFRAEGTAGAAIDNPVTLRIHEEVPAGAVPTTAVTPGTATTMLTGSPSPEGADCVCMYERTQFTQETVTLFDPMEPGDNVIFAGEDVTKGDVLAHSGEVIDTGVAGTLASQGVAVPSVYRKVSQTPCFAPRRDRR